MRLESNWKRGVLATPPDSFDPRPDPVLANRSLVIHPRAHTWGRHFDGFIFNGTFDLSLAKCAVELRQAASGAAVTLFVAGHDFDNWAGFRIAGGKLSFEARAAGTSSSKDVNYDPERHRWLRLRSSGVANLLVWETSADGKTWSVEYAATPEMVLSGVRIALSAGTESPVATPGAAAFDNFSVELR
jgi:hypothetical protein